MAAVALGAAPAVIGVYVHVPYCRTICPYCDFLKRRIDGEAPDAFIEALCREIREFEGPNAAISVFFGGGTPSLLSPLQLEMILEALHARFSLLDPEITLEANPDDVTPGLAGAWRALGVNRLSLGVQSFNDAALAYLGRRHGADGARRACEIAAGRFENWSMDLIFGAHPMDAWEATLGECRRFDPPHVSAYGLTYEEGTPFGKRAQEAIGEDTYLWAYTLIRERLPRHDRYEVSNYARPGYECRHNLVYWRNEAYAGFGPGAYSFIGGVRARNARNIDAYLADPGAKEESLVLTEPEIKIETVIQHLRLEAGLSKTYYQARFGTALDADFGPMLKELEAHGLIAIEAERVYPTAKGFELNNEIGLALV